MLTRGRYHTERQPGAALAVKLTALAVAAVKLLHILLIAVAVSAAWRPQASSSSSRGGCNAPANPGAARAEA